MVTRLGWIGATLCLVAVSPTMADPPAPPLDLSFPPAAARPLVRIPQPAPNDLSASIAAAALESQFDHGAGPSLDEALDCKRGESSVNGSSNFIMPVARLPAAQVDHCWQF